MRSTRCFNARHKATTDGDTLFWHACAMGSKSAATRESARRWEPPTVTGAHCPSGAAPYTEDQRRQHQIAADPRSPDTRARRARAFEPAFRHLCWLRAMGLGFDPRVPRNGVALLPLPCPERGCAMATRKANRAEYKSPQRDLRATHLLRRPRHSKKMAVPAKSGSA